MLKKIYRPIKPIDNWLRTAHPWIWATRIHEHLYLGFILIFISGLIGSAFSFDTSDIITRNETFEIFAWMFIPATALLGFFLYRMALFNPHKRLGKHIPYQEFFEFIIYTLTIVICLALPYSTVTAINIQVANTLNKDDIAKYEKELEIGKLFFPKRAYDYDYFNSPEQYNNFISSLSIQNSQWRDAERQANSFHNFYSEEKRDDIFNHEKNYRDRRPRLYFKIDYKKYRKYKYGIGSGYYYDDEEYKREYLEFCDEIIAINQTSDPTIAKKYIYKTCDLLEKFSKQDNIDRDKILNDFINHRYSKSHAYYYITELSTAEDNLYYILRAQKWNNDYFDDEAIWGFLLGSFCIALLFFVFKNIHWKQLLLGLLTGAIILTIITITLASTKSSEEIVINTLFSVFLVYFALNSLILTAKTYSVWLNIIAMGTNIILPFFFSFFIVFCDENKLIDYEDFYQAINFLFDDSPNQGDTFILGLVYGIGFYIFLGNSYMKYIYRKLLYLPRKS